MSIAKATGQLNDPYRVELGAFTGREYHGPAAIPIAAAAITLFSAANTAENQGKAAKASQALQGQEEATLGQEQSLASQIAGQPIDLSGITRAGESGIETLKSTGGGVPNLGAMIQQLLGKNQQTAQTAAIGQKSANLSSAANILGGTTAPLNQLGTQAGAAAGAGGNPWSAAAGTALSAFNKPKGPVVTGPGAPGGGDVTVPGPSSAGYPSNIPTTGTGFNVTSPFGPSGGDTGIDTSGWGSA